MNGNAENGGVNITEACVLASLRQTVYDAFLGETFAIRQAAVRDGHLLGPMLEYTAELAAQYDAGMAIPGFVQERFGPDRLGIELWGAKWSCTGGGHCHAGYQHLPLADAPNWAIIQWRITDTDYEPYDWWSVMFAEWVGDRWVLRYQSFCDWHETYWNDAISQIFDVELDVACPPDPRAGDPVWFRTGTLGWSLSGTFENWMFF